MQLSRKRLGTILGLFLFVLSANTAFSEDLTVKVVQVHDGDTITVQCDACYPGIFRRLGVRFLGCDTPELKDKRPEIAAKAREAREFVREKIKPGDEVTLRDLKRDKYGGRIAGRVEVGGVDLCREMIERGLAKEYHGGTKEAW